MPQEKRLIFKVAEAELKDVGRAIVRIDPKDLSKVHAQVGDIVKVCSQKFTRGDPCAVAKIMPGFEPMRGKDIIQIDGISRDNVNVGLGEKVEVQKVKFSRASTVVIKPLTSESSFTEEDSEYLAQMLDGTPVIKGNTIRVTLLGTHFQDFQIMDTDPDDIVVITLDTIIKVEGAHQDAKRAAGITYEDIGGLKKEIGKIREMIELPLKYPELFERLGIQPPKGVLLHGPPGCGKTLIARAVANETDAYFTHISGPEIMGKFYGESEGRLREVFEEAQAHTPAILFIDEIDAIAPKREDMGGEKQVERRVVAQLLALMDGLESRGQLIVIGATNIPNTLDPALRRPGRFDREITLPIPDKNARREILEIHTRGMPLAKDVELEKLAEITHGFVGADLEALCREAAMAALRQLMPQIEFDKNYIPYKKLLELVVTLEHFRQALKDVEPSALREVFTEVPNVLWKEIGGLEDIKQTLQEAIQWPLIYLELFEHAKTRPPKGILLYGQPGTGKTLLAKAAATESGVNFISVKGPELLSKYIGESERAIRDIFKKAKQASPCIVFFDELDSLVPIRSQGADSKVSERVVSQFLTELDGIEELQGVIVLGATNRLDLIDPALLRAGRFDFLLEISKPNEQTRLEIFKIHTQGKPLASDIDLHKLAQQTETMTGADIETLCRKAALEAMREFVSQKSTDKKRSKIADFTITQKHFKKYLSKERDEKQKENKEKKKLVAKT